MRRALADLRWARRALGGEAQRAARWARDQQRRERREVRWARRAEARVLAQMREQWLRDGEIR